MNGVHVATGLQNASDQDGRRAKCICELEDFAGEFPTDPDDFDSPVYPEGFFPDSLKVCHCKALEEATENFTRYEWSRGPQAGSEYNFARGTDKQHRLALRKVWVEITGIEGIRVDPPQCVKDLTAARYGASESGGFKRRREAGPRNNCACATCAEYWAAADDTDEDG